MINFMGDTISINMFEFVTDDKVTVDDLQKRIRGHARTRANTCAEFRVLLGNSKDALILVSEDIEDARKLLLEQEDPVLADNIRRKLEFFDNWPESCGKLTDDELFRFANNKLLKGKGYKITREEFDKLDLHDKDSPSLYYGRSVQLLSLNFELRRYCSKKERDGSIV